MICTRKKVVQEFMLLKQQIFFILILYKWDFMGVLSFLEHHRKIYKISIIKHKIIKIKAFLS